MSSSDSSGDANGNWDGLPDNWKAYWKYAHLPEDQIPKCRNCGKIGETIRTDAFDYCFECTEKYKKILAEEREREREREIEEKTPHGERYPGESIAVFNGRRRAHIESNDTCQCKMCYEYMRDHGLWQYGRRDLREDEKELRMYIDTINHAHATEISHEGLEEELGMNWHGMREKQLQERMVLTEVFMSGGLSYEDYWEDRAHVANREYDKLSKRAREILGLDGAPRAEQSDKNDNDNNLGVRRIYRNSRADSAYPYPVCRFCRRRVGEDGAGLRQDQDQNGINRMICTICLDQFAQNKIVAPRDLSRPPHQQQRNTAELPSPVRTFNAKEEKKEEKPSWPKRQGFQDWIDASLFLVWIGSVILPIATGIAWVAAPALLGSWIGWIFGTALLVAIGLPTVMMTLTAIGR